MIYLLQTILDVLYGARSFAFGRPRYIPFPAGAGTVNRSQVHFPHLHLPALQIISGISYT